jgi:hypothetical protein
VADNDQQQAPTGEVGADQIVDAATTELQQWLVTHGPVTKARQVPVPGGTSIDQVVEYTGADGSTIAYTPSRDGVDDTGATNQGAAMACTSEDHRAAGAATSSAAERTDRGWAKAALGPLGEQREGRLGRCRSGRCPEPDVAAG